MCRFLETIRVEAGQPLHLEFHQARVLATAAAYGWRPLELCETVAEILRGDVCPGGTHTPGGCGRQKLRILYQLSANGPTVLQHELLPYHIRPVRSLVCIEAGALRYDLKFADRSKLEQLQPAAKDTEPLFLRHGYLTDSRYANLVLREAGGRLMTPQHPLLEGTARARLLAAGLLHTAPIHLRDLPDFQSICLINAMLDIGDCQLPISAIRHYPGAQQLETSAGP
ncbi:MAG: aminotransferase class IV [Spirochaetia bacterium]